MGYFESAKLSQLLGQPLIYRGITCRVIDILEDEPALVLQDCTGETVIQPNQYGEASRRVPQVLTVPLLNVRRDGLNPALGDIDKLL